MFEKTVAYFCGPALAGIKPSNLVSLSKADEPDIYTKVNNLNIRLNKKGIYAEILCECEKRVLLLVYRKKALLSYLGRTEIKEFLISCGYDENFELQKYLGILKSRLNMCDFPHEIGAFLGYPLHDIYGFINHKNEGCLLTGEWKVYKNMEYAKKQFAIYAACRSALVKRLESGKSLDEIFCA